MENYSKTKIVITGASGFLGGRTAAFFAEEMNSNFDVIATSRRSEKKKKLENLGCTFIPGDLCSADFCDQLTSQADIVVHCAALSSPYGPKQLFVQSNLIATKTLIESCKKNGVNKFIYISTPSIYVTMKPRFNVKESDPLPSKMINHYAATKYQAELMVLKENSSAFQTIALRPRAIIGAEDTVIFPRVFEAYNKDKLKIVGKGTNFCDLTCVRNVIEAIRCSIFADSSAYGQPYNITNGESVDFWQTLNYALQQLGYKSVEKRIPKMIALSAATLIESLHKLFAPHKEPALTRYGIAILSDDFTLSIEKASTLLNYKPVMTTKEGIDEFIDWYKQQTK